MPSSCIVCGSCVVDLVCRPVDLSAPVGLGTLHVTDPVLLTGGGISINAGVTMARLGVETGVLSSVGDDAWGVVVRDLLRRERVDDRLLQTHPTASTSTTVVLVDATGERSFLHCVGAPELLDAGSILGHLDAIGRADMFLLGYYSLMPNLEGDLPDVFARIRAAGCRTAMDSAGAGGSMQPLDRILPHLDVYVPSLKEASHQTGLEDPKRIIEVYRDCGAEGLLGVKLGARGVVLSPAPGRFVSVGIVAPPGEVIDTTGAGDSFYAGLIAGLLRSMSVPEAGRLGAAAAACCITAVGGSRGGRDYAATSKLAGIG